MVSPNRYYFIRTVCPQSELFAQVRSLVNTAHRQAISAFDAIFRALTVQQTDWRLG